MDDQSVVVVPRRSHLAPPFQKGQVANPAGRPKGAKNKITLLKYAIENDLREQMKGEMSEILKKGLKMAKEGNEDMIKYFLDKWVTPAKVSYDEDAPKERVQIVIGRLDPDTNIQGRIIDHEPST